MKDGTLRPTQCAKILSTHLQLTRLTRAPKKHLKHTQLLPSTLIRNANGLQVSLAEEIAQVDERQCWC